MEKKKSSEKERQQQVHNTTPGDERSPEAVIPQSNTNGVGANEGTRSNSSSPNNKRSSRRVPPPITFTDSINEQALDAAAAHDVPRELDTLKINQPQPNSPNSGKQQQQEI